MITFQCTCHHRFEVADDQAGADLQCPRCGRLNTVPSAQDLKLLADDGTYQVEGPVGPEKEDPELAAELGRIYRHSRLDEFGHEIDLRSHATPLDYERVGVDPLDMKPEGRDKPPPPKYDPETGELIRPMEIRKDPTANVRAALPAIRPNRRRVAVERLERVAPFRLIIELFRGPNLVVMGIILIVHFFFIFLMSLPVVNFLIFIPGMLLMLLFLPSHYGNVIDETGPSSADELPRPLRNLGWEDTWGPFRAFIISTIVCYGPTFAFLFLSVGPWKLRLPAAMAAAILGTIAAPAVMLTTTTSGSIANLRPDRVFGTIRAMGAIYPLLLVQYLLAVPIYLLAFTESTLGGLELGLSGLKFTSNWYFAYPLLVLGVFLMHHFAWTLGHVYRVHHRAFPWVYQGPLREGEGEPRGFAVVPKPRKAKSTPPPATAIPVAERTPTHHEQRMAQASPPDQARPH